MKVTLEIDTGQPYSLSKAFKVLNALKDDPATAAAPAAPAPAPNAAPAAPIPPAAPAPAAPPPAPASAPPAPAPSPAPAPAPAPAAAAPAPAPPPPAGGMTQAQFGEQVQKFAKAYTPKACKARFGELSARFGVNWTKTSDIPPERFAEVAPWFAVQA